MLYIKKGVMALDKTDTQIDLRTTMEFKARLENQTAHALSSPPSPPLPYLRHCEGPKSSWRSGLLSCGGATTFSPPGFYIGNWDSRKTAFAAKSGLSDSQPLRGINSL